MNLPGEVRQISLDELPQYSRWIPYLVGLNSLGKTLEKNSTSIQREFGQEKWGSLLRYLKTLARPTVEDADKFFMRGEELPFYADGKFYVGETGTFLNYYVNILSYELAPLVANAGHLVEFGAGYGSILFKLAEKPGFEKVNFTAAEYTDTGIECMNVLAEPYGPRFRVGYCDLQNLDLTPLNVPQGAVYMTSWTMACIKGFAEKTLLEIIKHRPEAVVHFEPVFEHWDDNTLVSMLWRRYLQLNDYNLSMYSTLKQYEARGLIKIVEEKKNFFGGNPLAPVSMVKWIPC